jgi:ribonuclease HI
MFLEQAQRGFIRNGGIDQCIDVLLDVIEDNAMRRRSARRRPRAEQPDLYVLSYDQRKAFDSVQQYSIRASLERFNFPQKAVDFICSSLEDAWSAVRTKGGMTKRFPVRASVRQGDPLSPLVYIMVIDALHEGYRKNPLHCQNDGYFMGSPSIRVTSLGYADDTIVVAHTWEALRRLHSWTLAFFAAHRFGLNGSKSHLAATKDPTGGNLVLEGTGESDQITSVSLEEAFRYLGLWLTLSLSWTKQVAAMEQAVLGFCSTVSAQRLDLNMVARSYREYLLPRLEIGFKFASVSRRKLNSWMERVKRTALAAAGVSRAKSISKKAFCAMLGVISLEKHSLLVRASEMFIRLNSSSLSSRSGSIRAHEGTRVESGRLVALRTRTPNRTADIIREARKIGFSLWSNAGHDRVPKALPHEQFPVEDGADRISVFTDGSTSPFSSVSAYAAVVFGPGMSKPVAHASAPMITGGNNYMAEGAAVLEAVRRTPDGAGLYVYSDSLSLIKALHSWQSCCSTRQRLRSELRPVLNGIVRSASRLRFIHIEHVPAHTEGTDWKSVGNAYADELANDTRSWPNWGTGKASRFMEMLLEACDERFRPCLDGRHIMGDVRKALRDHLDNVQFQEWAALSEQGKLAATYPERMREAVAWVRRQRDPHLSAFLVQLASNCLPGSSKWTPQVGGSCPLCLEGVRNDAYHMFTCSADAEFHNAALLRLKRELGLFGINLDKPSLYDMSVARLIEECLDAAKSSQLCYKPTEDRARSVAVAFAQQEILSGSASTTPFLNALQTFNNDRRDSVPEWSISPTFAEAFWRPARLCWEMITDCWTRLTMAERWLSIMEGDLDLGAHGGTFDVSWVGKNGLVAINPFMRRLETAAFLTKAADALVEDAPTRFVIIAPASADMDSIAEKAPIAMRLRTCDSSDIWSENHPAVPYVVWLCASAKSLSTDAIDHHALAEWSNSGHTRQSLLALANVAQPRGPPRPLPLSKPSGFRHPHFWVPGPINANSPNNRPSPVRMTDVASILGVLPRGMDGLLKAAGCRRQHAEQVADRVKAWLLWTGMRLFYDRRRRISAATKLHATALSKELSLVRAAFLRSARTRRKRARALSRPPAGQAGLRSRSPPPLPRPSNPRPQKRHRRSLAERSNAVIQSYVYRQSRLRPRTNLFGLAATSLLTSHACPQTAPFLFDDIDRAKMHDCR